VVAPPPAPVRGSYRLVVATSQTCATRLRRHPPCRSRPRASAAPLSVVRPFALASNESSDTCVLPFASQINHALSTPAYNRPFEAEVIFCVQGARSPMLANIYMNRFLKYWRLTKRGDAFRAHVVAYADDFVILSRGRAAEAVTWTKAVMMKLGLTLNEAKTSLKDARQEPFDFPGFSFGPHRYKANGQWYLGASPSKKSVQRLKTKVGNLLVPGNHEPWAEVRDTLNQSLLGWSNYFSYCTRRSVFRGVDRYVYERVRDFLARPHKVAGPGTKRFSCEIVYGERGLRRLERLPLTAPSCASR